MLSEIQRNIFLAPRFRPWSCKRFDLRFDNSSTYSCSPSIDFQHPFPLRKFIIFNFRAWYHLICIVNCHICHFFNGKSGIRSIYSSVSSLAPLFSNISSQFNEQILPNTCLRHTNSLGHLMVSYNGVTTSNYHVTHTNLTSAFFYFMNYRWMTNNNLANFATQKVRIQFKS